MSTCAESCPRRLSDISVCQSTIRNSTCIYLVDAGKVVESGTYDELIQKNGEFTSLAAAGGDETAASIGKDADLEEVTKKELKKKLHKVLDTLRESYNNRHTMSHQVLGFIQILTECCCHTM